MKPKLFHKFSESVGYHGKAISFIGLHKMGWIFIIPFCVTIVVFTLGIFASSEAADYILALIEPHLHFNKSLEWLTYILTAFLFVFLRIVLFVVFGFIGGFVSLILLSPFLAFISEKVEEKYSGNIYEFKLSIFLEDVLKSILLSLRNGIIELTLIVLIFVFSFIPILGQLAGSIAGTLFLFFISAYFYGFSFLDFTLERKGFTIKQRIQYVRKRKGKVMGTGFLYALSLLIPFLGIFIANFVAVISVVSATLLVLDDKEE